jgi:hypothetical protein
MPEQKLSTIDAERIVADLRTMLLVREGETITPELAAERARNITVCVLDLVIAEVEQTYKNLR